MSIRLAATTDALQAAFGSLTTPRDVAALLDVPYARLAYHLYKVPAAQRYTAFSISKRSGAPRLILAPATALRLIQQKLHQVLQAVYEPRHTVHGFTLHRNLLTNAAPHVARRWVLNVDLQGFFQAINFGRVRGLFLAPPYSLPADVATVLAQICCHENQLPQGAPTSPIVSNLICRPLDGRLQRLAKSHHCFCTRYADDITFSTNARQFPPGLAASSIAGTEAGPELVGAVMEAGFQINAAKTRLMNRRTRQTVTGLIVNTRPNVDRRLIRQVRAMLHAWRRHGLPAAQQEYEARYMRRHRNPERGAPDFKRVLRGKIEFIGLVRSPSDALYERLLGAFEQLAPSLKGARRRRFRHAVAQRLDGAVWVLECDTEMKQGTAFLLDGVGLVTCAHVLGVTTRAFRPDDPSQTYDVQVRVRDDARDLAVLDFASTAATSPTSALSRSTGLAPDCLDVVYTAGFPNYRRNDSLSVKEGRVAGFRTWGCERRLQLSTAVIRGMSGGPVLNAAGDVVGVAATGADRMERADATEDHGAIPIDALDRLEHRREGIVETPLI